MAYTDYLDSVQKIYIAYYGRPADPFGQEYWAKQLDARGGSLAAIIDAFGNSAEATTLFSGMSNAAKVNAIYQQCFDRDAEVAGLTYYTNALTAGTYTQASIMLNILNGATGTDVTTVANKLAVANLFTASIDTTVEIIAYDGDAAAAAARAWLRSIDDIYFYLPPFIFGHIDPPGDWFLPGQTFTLTTGPDNITGTSSNETIDGSLSGSTMTFGSLDKIDGGEGTDTMTLSINGTGVYSASTLSNVENIQASFSGAGTGTLDLTSATGVSSVAVAVADFTNDAVVNGLAAGTALAVRNIAGDVTFNFASGALSGPDDEITLTIENAHPSLLFLSFGGDIFIGPRPDYYKVIEINLGNGIETLNVVSSGGVTNHVAALNETGATATISKIVITGDTGLEIGAALESTVKTVDASAATGALSFTVGSTTTSTVTGGSASDTIIGGSGNDVISGGAGNDTITGDVGVYTEAFGLTDNANAAGDVLTGGADFDTFILQGDLASEAVATAYAKAAYITDFTVGSTATTTDILQLSANTGNYSATALNYYSTGHSSFFAGVAAAAAGATTIQTVAQNAAAAIVTDTDLIKLTTPVATTGLTVQQAFNNAIGTGTVTGLVADNDIFFSLYDSTNSRMLVGLVDAGAADTVIATGDVVTWLVP